MTYIFGMWLFSLLIFCINILSLGIIHKVFIRIPLFALLIFIKNKLYEKPLQDKCDAGFTKVEVRFYWPEAYRHLGTGLHYIQAVKGG